MKTREFFDNITRILVHAFLGTALSAVVVAYVVLYLTPLLGGSNGMNFAECLTFGAMISATDPVTTLAIFKEQRLAENGLAHLYISVLGESVLNDAVGITLFASFSRLVMLEKSSVSLGDTMEICGEFAWTFAGSMLIGGFMGLVMPLVLKYTPFGNDLANSESADSASTLPDADSEASDADELHLNVPELGVAFVLALLPYLMAEALDLSGIVAIMFAGMTARYYAHNNMTKETRAVFLPLVDLVAQLCETYVFIILGLGVFLVPGRYSLPLITATIVGCLLGRAAHVYPGSWAVNRASRSERLTANEQHMLWFAGLRGAIAFICAFSFPETATAKHRYAVIQTTIVIVGASLVVLGWSTEPVMRLLNLRRPPACTDGSRSSPESSKHRRMASDEPQGACSRFAHRRMTSAPAPAPLPEADEEGPGWLGQTGNDAVRSMDSCLRRLLMTRDAIVTQNMALIKKPGSKRGSQDRLRDPLLQVSPAQAPWSPPPRSDGPAA